MITKNILNNNFKHFFVLVIFCCISLLYFSPVLQGKKILQNDIVQYEGMAKQHKDFAETTGDETYWTNSAFSGMPTYQLGAKYPHNYIKKLDLLLRFLPRPADYLFLYFLGFYILMLSLKVEYRLAVLGALAFGFSTYLIIIIGAGHNAKAHAIAYMPLVIAGILMVFDGKYSKGFILSTLALGLQFCANHFQMTYYLMFIVLAIGFYTLIDCWKNNQIKHFFKSIGILFSALFIALLLNATNLMATSEYANESTRGNVSELTINSDGSSKEIKSGLDKEYITQWSYGVFESLNLFIPRIMGGGSAEDLGVDSNFYKFLKENGYTALESRKIVKNAPAYWGDQPFVEAPAYIGIVVFFLFVYALFTISGKYRYWAITAIILSLLLSYGKNFNLLTDIFIDYFPLYNKFRAVSSIQVILELCIPLIAVLGLSTIITLEAYENCARLKGVKERVCIMIDARRMEVYSRISDLENGVIKKTSPDILDKKTYLEFDPFMAIGDGAEKMMQLWEHRQISYDLSIKLSAIGQVVLAYNKYLKKETEHISEFEPNYIKEFMITPSKKSIN